MKIGSTELKHGLMLAPMAGYTDHAMRVICREWGCEYSVSEMISAAAVVHGDKKTISLARIGEGEGAVALQLFGQDPSTVAEAAAALTTPTVGAAPVAIDLNMGCPVHKIFSNGEGSALMRSPDLIYRIVRQTAASTPLPVTVKLRLGIDSQHINVCECAVAAEEGGAALVTVHGRTRVEMYSGKANYSEIAKVKKCLHIPVVANGDICSGQDAARALLETGADAVAIGRGAVGNPFLFREIIAYVNGEEYEPPSLDLRSSVALRQLSLAIEEKGEGYAVREARKQIALYFRAFRGAAELRAEINSALTFAEVEAAVNRLLRANEA